MPLMHQLLTYLDIHFVSCLSNGKGTAADMTVDCLGMLLQGAVMGGSHMALFFSSIAAITGPAGSAGYAAANSTLDISAHSQQKAG